MSRIKYSIVALMILCLGAFEVNAAIPIIDWSAHAQRITILAKEMAKWSEYIRQFTRYQTLFTNLKNNFDGTVMRIAISELTELTGIDLGRIQMILGSVAHSDLKRLDDWRRLFYAVEKLIEKFPNLKDYGHITGNKYSQVGNIKTLYDREMQRNDEKVEEIENMMKKMLYVQAQEKGILEFKLLNFKNKIQEFGTAEVPNVAKVYTAINLMDMEMLKLNYDTLVMLRTWFEFNLKEKVNEIDQDLLLGRLQADDTAALYDSVK